MLHNVVLPCVALCVAVFLLSCCVVLRFLVLSLHFMLYRHVILRRILLNLLLYVVLTDVFSSVNIVTFCLRC